MVLFDVRGVLARSPRREVLESPEGAGPYSALSRRGQLGHERPDHLRRTRPIGIRRHDRTTKHDTDKMPHSTGSR